MKKPNRIARKGDITRAAAQTKDTAALPCAPACNEAPPPENVLRIAGKEIACFDDQILFRRGNDYYLVTEAASIAVDDNLPDAPGEIVHHLTREQVREWIDRTIIEEIVPREFHRDFRHRENLQPQLESLALGEVLSGDCILGLAKLERDGISIAAQVSGAVASWLAFAEYTEALPGGKEKVKAAPGILDCTNFDYTIARRRQSFLTESTARFFVSLVAKARQMPFAESRDYFSNLADLIEYHPGLANEHTQLMNLVEAEYHLGRSPAVVAALAAGGNAQ